MGTTIAELESWRIADLWKDYRNTRKEIEENGITHYNAWHEAQVAIKIAEYLAFYRQVNMSRIMEMKNLTYDEYRPYYRAYSGKLMSEEEFKLLMNCIENYKHEV